MGARGRRWLLVLLPLSLSPVLPFSAAAQAPDSLAAPPGTLAAALVAPEGPQPGRPVPPVPALTPALDAADLLAAAPGAFVYDLGAPGWPHGLALDGLAPEAHALTLDGRPYDDLFTGRPREDLLPLEVLDRLRLGPTRYGRPGAVVATTRPFRAATPVTELRYLPGQEGVQYVSAAHAQTRRLPAFLRDAAGQGRLTVLGYVAGRKATGPFAGEDLGGWQALGRFSVARPGFAVELAEHHVRHTQGARSGLAPAGGDFSTVFDPFEAVVLDAQAERQSVRNDLSLALRAPLLGDAPLTAEAYWTRQHERYTADGLDTLTAKGNRYGGRLAQPLAAGPHGLLLRLDGWSDGAPWGAGNPYAGAGSRVHLHAALRDSLTVGGWHVEAEGGAHAAGGALWPAAAMRVTRGGLFAGAHHAAEAPARLAEAGYASVVTGLDEGADGLARTTGAEAGLALAAGDLALRLRAYANQTSDPLVLAEVSPDSLAFARAEAAFRRLGGSLALAWRAGAPRGFYADAQVHAFRFLNADASALHARAADALPALWGSGRLGLRFLDLFGGVLDLDLAARARAWTAFGSRLLAPAPALFALPDPAATVTVPARGTLDLLAEAQLQERASFFLRYENALATRLYDGAYLVPVYPLPAHRLRFGVFWTLFN
jgi:hypothetical protein